MIKILSIYDSLVDLNFPNGHQEDTLLWNGYVENHTCSSLLKYIDVHGESLRAKYLAFIHDLGEARVRDKKVIEHFLIDENFSLWWMSLFVEKSSFKSPRILDCFRIMALEEIISEKRPEKVHFISADPMAKAVIEKLCKRLGIRFRWIKKRKKSNLSLRQIFDNLPHFLQGLIYLVRHILTRWSLKKIIVQPWYKGENVVFLFSNFFNLDLKKSQQGKFHSRQWEDLPDYLLRSGVRLNLIHHFLYSPDIKSAQVATTIMDRYNKNNNSMDAHAFLDSFLSVNILIRVFVKWIKLSLRVFSLGTLEKIFIPKGSNASLWDFLKNDWYASSMGKTGMMNIIWFELLSEAMRTLPKQKLGLYLCENQDWERAFVYCWQKNDHGTLIAVAHSTVRFWDLRYFADKRTLEDKGKYRISIPDKIAVNGLLAKNMMLNAGYKESDLLEVEALRYQYLEDCSENVVLKAKAESVSRLLLLGNFTYDQTVEMIKCLDQASKSIRENFQYSFKPHPVCNIPLQNYTSLLIETTFKPLMNIVPHCDWAFSSNTTSAGLDAYLAGLKVAVFLDKKDFNFSPLRGFADVNFVSCPEELASSLNGEKDKNKTMVKDVFWLDANLPRWFAVLADRGIVIND